MEYIQLVLERDQWRFRVNVVIKFLVPYKTCDPLDHLKDWHPIQWVKQPEREADHSPPSTANVKNAWRDTSTPPNKSSWRGAYLRTGTTLTFTFISFSKGRRYMREVSVLQILFSNYELF
jgi:hypothetical protein